MANPEHVELVKQGAEAIARWQKQHPGEHLDLSRANFHRANLARAKLSKANLSGANLFEADLSWADLSGANLNEANLVGATLSRVNLRGAALIKAKLLVARIIGADLSEADLSGADLTGADLVMTNLRVANLNKADLSVANLSRAKLTETNLFGANLNGADLSMANLTAAQCLNTVFADCNLHQARGLEVLVHQEPSSIGIDTMIASFRAAGNRLTPELEIFFRGAGVPRELLAALPGILAKVRYCTCFICYGEPDKEFAERLCKDLKARGVYCWLYSMDAVPGEKTWKEIGQRRREADKMVVLCSAQALVRDGVLKEIEEQIDEGPDKMVPVSLDELWKAHRFPVMRGDRDLKPFLLERNYADFSGAMPYDEALERLIKGLERKQRKKRKKEQG